MFSGIRGRRITKSGVPRYASVILTRAFSLLYLLERSEHTHSSGTANDLLGAYRNSIASREDTTKHAGSSRRPRRVLIALTQFIKRFTKHRDDRGEFESFLRLAQLYRNKNISKRNLFLTRPNQDWWKQFSHFFLSRTLFIKRQKLKKRN